MAPKRKREQPSSAPPPLLSAALSPPSVASAAHHFSTSHPYTHLHLPHLFDPTHLSKVARELRSLGRTFKETDLFKVYQTGDLANLDPREPEHAAALPHTLELREAIYSPAFRSFIEQVTGCPPLTAKTDLSCNTYKRGGHLLCHDDVIGTRCVSFILYLSWKGKEWREELGGGLELYPVDASGEGAPVVSHTPSAVVPPQFASMAFFTVQPGRSYHAVAEVLSSEPRLSISGWFHAESPPVGAETAASLAQLQAKGTSSSTVAPRKLLPIGRSLLPEQEKQAKAHTHA
ncbi:MAG: hypothetical protein SGPRY_012872 [Prymnesium sp.]